MIAVRIGPKLRMAVVGSPAYFVEHGRPATPHDLTRHRCINIRLPSVGSLYAWEFERDGREINVRVAGPLVVNDTLIAARAAINGVGLDFIMKDLAASALTDGRLERVQKNWCDPFPGYHLYYPDRRHPSPAFSALMDPLRQRRDKRHRHERTSTFENLIGQAERPEMGQCGSERLIGRRHNRSVVTPR